MTNSKLDNILERYSEADHLPCALGAVVTRDKGLVYLGGRGRRDVADPAAIPAGPDTTLAFFSCTKAVTTTALLQLLERGLIRSIDDPVEEYVPEMRDIQVLVRGKDGAPQLRAPATKPTIRHLLTHGGLLVPVLQPRVCTAPGTDGHAEHPQEHLGRVQDSALV